MVPRRADFDLSADEIVGAAIDIFNECRVDAVSMPSVSSRLGVKTMRRDGLAADVAVQACRLLMWATVGFGAEASGATPHGVGRQSGR